VNELLWRGAEELGWRDKSDLGLEVIEKAHDTLKITNQWRTDQARGYTWWASDFAFRVWAEEGFYHNATATYRLHIETDLLRGRGKAHQFEVALEKEMDSSSMSAVVYDHTDDTYRLHCSVFLNSDNAEWLSKLFPAAAVLQLSEANSIVHDLARVLHATPAVSEHPQSGMRREPDPMLHALDQWFKPLGQKPSHWLGAAEWRDMERYMERQAVTFECDHQSVLRATFDWRVNPNLSQVLECTCHEPHPILGNGLHLTLTLPLELAPEPCAHLALQLNQHERHEWKRSHMIGSWCVHGTQLAFRAFLPNTVYQHDLLPQIALTMALRAQWVDEYFLELYTAAQHH